MSDENVIDFAAAKEAREEKPDAEHVRWCAEEQRNYYRFFFDYKFEGSSWSFDVWAVDRAQAEARVEAIKQTLVYGGQTYSIIPV